MKPKKLIPGLALLLIALALPVVLTSGYLIQTFIMVLLYAYWASSWNIIGGYGGQFSLGHAVYIGVGAYTSTVLFMYNNISPWIGMLVGGLIAGILSLIIGYPTFRLKGSYFTLSTVALLYVIRIIFTSEDTILGYNTMGAMGLKVPWMGNFMDMQFMDKTPYYYIILGMLLIVVFISYKINKSKTGYYLAAINTNQDAANSLGVNVTYYKMKAQFISAFLTAVGGTFYAQLILFVDPSRLLGYDLSVEIVILAIIGGRGTLWGPVIGAILLVPINELLRSYLGAQLAGISIVIYGVIMMLIVYFMPEGLGKFFFRFTDWVFGERKSRLNKGVK